MSTTLTAIDGLEVGHYTDLVNATGCTVVLCRKGATGGVDVRGGSPGTRETDLLRPGKQVNQLHAILLSGGSAFGLDAASGVVRYLEERRIGYQAGPALVPIVSAAILFDLRLGNSRVRPGPEQGYAACEAAGSAPPRSGTVGAGTGATVAKVLGFDRGIKSGIGSAGMKLRGGATVAALVAVNAIGGVYDHHTGRLLAGPRRIETSGMDDPMRAALQKAPNEDFPRDAAPLTNTTIGVVATDASLTREEANALASVSHDGLALAVRPCHTHRDGDTMFAMSTNNAHLRVDPTALYAAAVEVTAAAVIDAVSSATGLGGFPSISEMEEEQADE